MLKEKSPYSIVSPFWCISITLSFLLGCNLSRTIQDKVEVQGSIAAGGAHTCQTQQNGTVACWGNNQFGQLGNGTTDDSTRPVWVFGLVEVVDLTAGDSHTCAVLKMREVKCWGGNSLGQLGHRAGRPSLIPISVPINPATQVAAGARHTCARLLNGSVSCWGDNSDGQLGVVPAPTAGPSTPVTVVGITDAVSVAAGNEHSCAVLSDGELQCWGDNHFGQLGHGIQAHAFFPPRAVPVASGVLAVAAGRRHTCALLRDRTVQCWGENFDGQLGNGMTTGSLTPVWVTILDPSGTTTRLSNVTDLSAGWNHTCALLSNKDVYCWGSNRFGQIGVMTGPNLLRPTLSGLTQVTALATGGQHTCAILTNGLTQCTGRNHAGQVGNGTTNDVMTPVNVSR